eukprot:2486630-Amphidinium_carterae.1
MPPSLPRKRTPTITQSIVALADITPARVRRMNAIGVRRALATPALIEKRVKVLEAAKREAAIVAK